MDYIKGIVKKYSREYNRTLKDGTKKTYTTEQVQVTIPKSKNIFDDKEEVLILSSNEAQKFEDIDDIITSLQIFNIILQEENEELSLNLETNQNELKKYNTQILNLEDEITTLKTQLEDKDLMISNLDKNLNDKESSTAKELKDKDLLISKLEEKLNEKDKIISNLNTELDNSLLLEDYDKQLLDKDSTISNLNDQLKDNTSTIKDLNDKLSHKDTTIDNLNNELDDKALIIYDLNKKIESLNKRHDTLINNIRSLDYSVDANVSLDKQNLNYSFEDYVNLQKEYTLLFNKYESSQERLYDEKINNIHYKNIIDKFRYFVSRLE